MTAQPHTVTTLPALKDVLHIARAAAARIAHRPEDIDDLIQIGLIAYHNDHARHNNVRKPWSLARTILQRAMVLYYYNYRHASKKWAEIQTRSEWKRSVSIEDVNDSMLGANQNPNRQRCFSTALISALSTGLDGARPDDQSELFTLEDYYSALENECGHTARVMVENLVSPSNPCIVAYILSEAQSKVDQRKQCKSTSVAARRRLPRGGGAHHPIRISQQMIREAMGLEPWEWAREMKRIKEFTTMWLLRNGSSHSTELLA